MQRVERTARIPAAPSEVFDYLADLGNLAEWQSGIVSAERVDSGPMRIGSSAQVTRELMGQRLSVPLTVSSTDDQPSGTVAPCRPTTDRAPR